ncbi:MAG: hypothetical protein HQK99_02645 [Nitrospirae bacterium]|nr:hypothetical protein [Nitrospirota bacterium]
MKKSAVAVFILAAAVVMLGCFTLVQANPPENVKDNVKAKEMAAMRQKIQALKKKRLVETLALNKELADKVFSIIDKHDSKAHELMHSMRDDIKNLKKAVDDKKDDTAKKAIIDKIAQTRTELIALKQAQIDDLKAVLSVDQQAKLILFSIDFQRTIRKIVAEKRRTLDNESKED